MYINKCEVLAVLGFAEVKGVGYKLLGCINHDTMDAVLLRLDDGIAYIPFEEGDTFSCDTGYTCDMGKWHDVMTVHNSIWNYRKSKKSCEPQMR